jgi:hypothetical protein
VLGTRRKPGRMGPWTDGLAVRFLELGYTPGHVRNRLKDVGQLGRWMVKADLQASQLTRCAVEAFVRARRADGHRRVAGVRSFEPVLDYLRRQGVLAAETPPATPVDELIAHYRTWLIVDRGLAVPTVLRYEKLARRFLQGRADGGGDCLIENLAGAEVIAFLMRESARLTIGAAKGRVAELRSLLRFLYLKGLTPLPLATAVPPVAGWHDTGVPAGLAAGDVQHLLDNCDRSSPGGIRDFAILMLVARLGLRSSEVARLELGDIDWRGGEIAVRGKARRRDGLPLPSDVGEALSDVGERAGVEGPVAEVGDERIEALDQLGDLGLGHVLDAQGAHQAVDPAGGNAANVALGHHRDERPLRPAAGLEQPVGEVAARPQLGDGELHGARPGVPGPGR